MGDLESRLMNGREEGQRASDLIDQRTDAVVTIVVPTRHEADNVGPLLEGISAALLSTAYEVLFVDDSDDDTPVRIAQAAIRAPARNIRLLHQSIDAPGATRRSSGMFVLLVFLLLAALFAGTLFLAWLAFSAVGGLLTGGTVRM